MSLFGSIIEPYKRYRLEKFNRLEKSLGEVEGSIRASPLSPEKGQADRLKVTLHELPMQLSIAKSIDRSLMSVRDSLKCRKTNINTVALQAFEEYARSLGIAAIGYTSVPPEVIFKDRAILYPNAIVFTMEMDKAAVDAAPSPATQRMGIETYDQLGKTTNILVDYLRQQGFPAHAGHPANSAVLHPRLAQKAGLGYKGRHGLIITPEFGPRTRLAAIFTGIDNLPLTDSDRHSWIAGFCKSCGKCIRSCPVKAILETPVEKAGGTVTHIEKDKCISCTVCMKACSFNRRSYAELRR